MATGNSTNQLDQSLATSEKELAEKVRVKARALEIASAVVVDDNLVPQVDSAKWITLVQLILQSDELDKLRERIEQIYVSHGIEDVEVVPDVEWLNEVANAVKEDGNSQSAEIFDGLVQRFSEPELIRLFELLDGLGIKPIDFAEVSEDQPPRDASLYFVDYRMTGDKEPGDQAGQLLSDIMDTAGSTGKPGAALLMSRDPERSVGETDWGRVAKRSGILRFNFRYHEKTALTESPAMFLAALYDLLASTELGQAYYEHAQEIRNEMAQVTEDVIEKVLGLTPADFGMFAKQHLDDNTGYRVTSHLFEMIVGLLGCEIRESESVQRTLRKFANTLRETELLLPRDHSECHVLHSLHGRLLYDRSEWVRNGPVDFGDIYTTHAESGTFFLVLTPECDLDVRHIASLTGDDETESSENTGETWRPKVDRILLIEGEICEKRDPSPADFLAWNPFPPFSESTSVMPWMKWDFRKPRYVNWSDLAPHGDKYLKWGRLRFTESDEIQQNFASDLTTVGTGDVFRGVSEHSFPFWEYRGPNSDPDYLGNASIVVMENPADPKDPFVAFGRSFEELLYITLKDRPIAPVTTVLELGSYHSKKECVVLLQRIRMAIYLSEERIDVVWSPQFALPKANKWPYPDLPSSDLNFGARDPV